MVLTRAQREAKSDDAPPPAENMLKAPARRGRKKAEPEQTKAAPVKDVEAPVEEPAPEPEPRATRKTAAKAAPAKKATAEETKPAPRAARRAEKVETVEVAEEPKVATRATRRTATTEEPKPAVAPPKKAASAKAAPKKAAAAPEAKPMRARRGAQKEPEPEAEPEVETMQEEPIQEGSVPEELSVAEPPKRGRRGAAKAVEPATEESVPAIVEPPKRPTRRAAAAQEPKPAAPKRTASTKSKAAPAKASTRTRKAATKPIEEPEEVEVEMSEDAQQEMPEVSPVEVPEETAPMEVDTIVVKSIKITTAGLAAMKEEAAKEDPTAASPQLSKIPAKAPPASPVVSPVKATNTQILEDPFVTASSKATAQQSAAVLEVVMKDTLCSVDAVQATPFKSSSIFAQSKTPAKSSLLQASARKAPVNSPLKAPPMSAARAPSDESQFKGSLLQASARKAPVESLLKAALISPTKGSSVAVQMKSSLLQGSARKPPAEVLAKSILSPIKAPMFMQGSISSVFSNSPRKDFHPATGTFAGSSKPSGLGSSLLQTSPRKPPTESPIKSKPNPFANIMRMPKPTSSLMASPMRAMTPARNPMASSVRAFAEETTPTNSPLLDSRTPIAGMARATAELPSALPEPATEAETTAPPEEAQADEPSDIEMEDAPPLEDVDATLELSEPTFPCIAAPAAELSVEDSHEEVADGTHEEPKEVVIEDNTVVRKDLFTELPSLSAADPESPSAQIFAEIAQSPERTRIPAPIFDVPAAPPLSPTKSSLRSPLKSLTSPKKSVSWDHMASVTELSPAPSTPGVLPTPGLLAGLVFFVDVRTSEGVDSGCLFAPLLEELGARCVGAWSGEGDVTHVLFKDGGKQTLQTVERAQNAGREVYCVNIGWALE